MKLPRLYDDYLHIVIKECYDKQEALDKVVSLPGVTVLLGSFENGNHGHFFTYSKYYKRYVNENKPFKNMLRIKEIKNSKEDYEKVISYIFKDKNTYEEYSSNRHNFNYANSESDTHYFKLFQLDLAKIYKRSTNTKGEKTKTKSDRYIDRLITAWEQETHLEQKTLTYTIRWVQDYTCMNITTIDRVIVTRFVYMLMNKYSKDFRTAEEQKIKAYFE